MIKEILLIYEIFVNIHATINFLFTQEYTKCPKLSFVLLM